MLGRVAASDNIRIFGLWNEKHLESDNLMTPEHLSSLEELVSKVGFFNGFSFIRFSFLLSFLKLLLKLL